VSDDFLRSGRHLHYGSYYLQTNLLPVAPQIMERARQLGLTVSLDTNWDPAGVWRQGVSQALKLANVFFLNDREALAISGAATVDQAAAKLAAQGPIVAVKLGAQGALVQAGRERIIAPVERVAQPVDTIGAGDSFDAGFLAAWLQGLPLAACAAVGNRCGRATTLARGGIAGQLHRSSVPELCIA
jgi:sugar/nucleoside kinase (ribokinase family)